MDLGEMPTITLKPCRNSSCSFRFYECIISLYVFTMIYEPATGLVLGYTLRFTLTLLHNNLQFHANLSMNSSHFAKGVWDFENIVPWRMDRW